MKHVDVFKRVLIALFTGSVLINKAAEIIKADNQDVLSAGSSWIGGVAPGADDVALWDGETAVSENWTYALGADVSWGGVRLTNAVSGLVVTNDGFSLSVGASGLDFSNCTNFICTLDIPIVLTADQLWKRGFYVNRPVSGNSALRITDGWFSFHEPLTITGGLTVGCGAHMRSNAVVSGPVLVQQGGTLCVNKAKDTAWRETFSAGVVTNKGVFIFGRPTGAGAIRLSTVSLQPDDTLTYPADLSADGGRINIYDNNLLQKGGILRANWMYVNSGKLMQSEGSTFVNYAAQVGYGWPGDDTNRAIKVSGGTLDVRRFHIGAANNELYPGILSISGGTVEVIRAGDNRYTGIELAAVRTENEDFNSSPAGILDVSGGTLRTHQISFGSTFCNRDDSWNVTSGFARFNLSGGEISVGAAGIGPNDVWNRGKEVPPDSCEAWYEILLSGGTLSAHSSFINRGRTRLSNADGGVTIRTENSDGTPYSITMREPLYGSGGLRKTGSGQLVLTSAVNTYTGKTVVAEGALVLGHDLSSARWYADDLDLAAGAEVTSWPCSIGKPEWIFTSTLANGINSIFTAPHLSPETMNGHKAVRFDGVTTALGMTGLLNESPISDATKLTLIAVVRPRGAGKGDGTAVQTGAGIIGSQFGETGSWGLALSANGASGAGVSSNKTNWSSVWDSSTNVVDSQPHILIYTWELGDYIEVNVDGIRTRKTGGLYDNPLYKTRMIMGANENLNCFNGDIAEIRFFKNVALSLSEQDKLGSALAAMYGAVYTTESSSGSSSAAVPDSSAVWVTDNLTGNPGDEVTQWPSTNGTWTFSSDLATAIGKTYTPDVVFDAPTIGTNLMNGHRVVSFNGKTDAMAITGNAATPTSGATNLTVAVVMRSDSVGVGWYYNDWRYGTTGIIGQTLANADNWWVIAYNSYGRAGAGIGSLTTGRLTSWGAPRNLNDGEPHVLIYVWEGGSNVTMNVDGHRTVAYDTEHKQTAPRFKTRCMLGATEKVCARVDIAEIRHYRGAFTPEQQDALGLELAQKYGAETVEYRDDMTAIGGSLASREVQVDAGASILTDVTGAKIAPGQTYSGAGKITGALYVGTNGVIVSSSSAALTIDKLVFEPGGVCRWELGENGEHKATEIVGDLRLPNGAVVIEIDDVIPNSSANGVVLSYGGELIDHGVVWQVRGGKRHTMVEVDTANKEIRLHTLSGTLLIIQ